MSNAVTTEPPVLDAREADVALGRIIEQLDAMRAQMRADDVEIARLKAESAELKAETRAILATLRSAS